MRNQQHLAEVERHHGTGDATDALRSVLHRGLRVLNEQRQAERVTERGTADKLNPHISDVGKCPRAVAYSLMNVEESEPFTDDSLMNFLVGHAVEEAWAKILTAAGAEYEREERVEIEIADTKVSGRQDFGGIRLRWNTAAAELLNIPEFAEIPDGAIIELKSLNSRAASWMLKKGEKGRAEHRRQLGLYLHAKQQPVGFLVYLVKDATKGEPILHAFRVDLDSEEAHSDALMLAGVHTLARSQTLPRIPEGYQQSKFPCTYCQVKTLCWLQASIGDRS